MLRDRVLVHYLRCLFVPVWISGVEFEEIVGVVVEAVINQSGVILLP
jgi:hypothetical protein